MSNQPFDHPTLYPNNQRFVYPVIQLSRQSSTHPFNHLSDFYPPICLFTCPSSSLYPANNHPFKQVTIYTSTLPRIHPPVHPSIHPSTHPSREPLKARRATATHFSPFPPHPRRGSERAAPPVFPGGIAGSAIPEPGRRSSRSCIRPAREVRPAAGSPGSRLLLLWVQPSLPPPLGRLWQSEAPANSLVAAADAAEAAGRSQAAGRPAARSPGAAAAAAALAQPPEVPRSPACPCTARRGRKPRAAAGQGRGKCARVRARECGGDSLELGQRSGQGNPVRPPRRPRRSPRFSRSGASSPAPLTMDLCGVGTRLSSSARVVARPWGCAGAREGMAR